MSTNTTIHAAKWTPARMATSNDSCMVSRWPEWKSVCRHSMVVAKLRDARKASEDRDPRTSIRAQPKVLFNPEP